jgi:hypothetical protein
LLLGSSNLAKVLSFCFRVDPVKRGSNADLIKLLTSHSFSTEVAAGSAKAEQAAKAEPNIEDRSRGSDSLTVNIAPDKPESLRRPEDKSPEPIRIENMQFAVRYPQKVVPGMWNSIYCFAYVAERPSGMANTVPDPVTQVEEQARQLLGAKDSQYERRTKDSSQPIPFSQEITFIPEVPGLEFNPGVHTFRCVESAHWDEFRLCASNEMAGQTARGQLKVLLASSEIAKMELVIHVDTTKAVDRAQTNDDSRVRRIIRIVR